MPVFEDAVAFAMHIEHRVLERGEHFTHLDAILEYCNENTVEPEDLKVLIKGALKDKLELCYQELNFLPRGAMLDL